MGFSSISHWCDRRAGRRMIVFGAASFRNWAGISPEASGTKAGLKEDEGTAAARLGNNG